MLTLRSSPPISLAAAWVSLALSPGFADDVKVLKSDARSVIVEYRPEYYPASKIAVGGTEYSRFSFRGAHDSLGPRSGGAPEVLYRHIPLAFPAEHGNSIRVLASEYQDLQSVRLAPAAKRNREGKTPASIVYEPDPVIYGRREFLPGRLATLSRVGRARDMLIGGINFYPVQFNPGAGTVRRYTRVVVEVTFGSPGSLPPPAYDALLKGIPANYDAARAWRGAALRPAATVQPSVLASGEWYRIPVTAEGMYRMDAAYLSALGINVNALDPRTLRIFGNGGRELPEDVGAARPTDLVENAVYVAGETDGKFDPGDFVLFYGRGARGWVYDPGSRALRHCIHDYSEVNYYWLTFGAAPGKRMASVPSLPPSAGVLVRDSFTDGVAIEDEKTNCLLTSGGEGSGRMWVGQQIAAGSSFTYSIPLPGYAATGPITYRYALVGIAPGTSSFTVSEAGLPIGYASVSVLSDYGIGGWGEFQASRSQPLAGSTSQLSVAYQAQGTSAVGYVDWLEIQYTRRLSAVHDTLRFYAPDTTAVVEYHLDGFSTVPMVFNVTSQEAVSIVTGADASSIFRAAETGGAPSAYWAAAGNGFRTPAPGVKMPGENLRGYAGGADLVIITAQQYISGANRLAAYRSDPAHGGLKVVVADVAQIYNEFSGGLTDVTAIRDYLKFALDNWVPAPRYVLMLGQASFDYKGILGPQASIVPTWESAESLDEVHSYATDDYFVEFGGTSTPSLVVGRLSARTAEEASVFVDKLSHYENNSAPGAWKTHMLFIGDDSWTPELGEDGDRSLHSDAAEELASPAHTPPEFEREKVFVAGYPTVYTAAGRRKPGAYQAILDNINAGVLTVNFAGHGNPSQLSNDDVFDVPTSIPQLTNVDRLSVFFLATCNFSEFDDPLNRSGGEILINKPDGGAVAVVSADRKVIAGYNNELTEGTYDAMFARDAYGRLIVNRPASALFAYKFSYDNQENDQKYLFLGDPTMQFQFPSGYASFDSINGLPMDSSGVPLQTVAQLRSLSKVTISGSVRDAANRIDGTYNGRILITLNDASKLQTIVNLYPGVNWTYMATGALLYRGENSVQNGRFNAAFVVPRDIQYGDSLSQGRLVAYVSRADVPAADGLAYTGRVHVGSADSAHAAPGSGPSVSLYLGNRSFRSGDLVDEHPLLLVDLADSDGINTSASGIGHGIEAWLNNAPQSIDLTEHYTNKLNSYREGTIQYQLSNLPSGVNTVRVRAWNSYDVSGTAETTFQVASSDQLSVTDIFNYPNPFGASGTEFTFRQNQSTPLSVTVKIFTVAGRLIRTVDCYAPGDSFVKIPWDGRDKAGDVIANGVYLYKLIVRTADGKYSIESIGKLSKVQ